MESAYLTADHTFLRDQVSRFLQREVEPHADAWERVVQVPRAVLQRMGQAGLLGLALEPAYGGGATEGMLDQAAKQY